MNTAVKLGAYAGGLAVAFLTAFSVGGAADPFTTDSDAPDPRPSHIKEADMNGHATTHDARSANAVGLPGLAVSQDGYTLVPASSELASGAAVPFRFTVTGPSGAPVTEYREEHEKELHLIVVRRDLAGFQHLHPARTADGTWRVPLNLVAAGIYRVFADFTPTALGRGLTLGADVFVAGDYDPAALPAGTASTTVDGYEVSLDAAPVAGRESEMTFTVTRGGAKVTDLQPYLGAFGHLIALRTRDLAYLHTHPTVEAREDDRGGPQVTFATAFPTAGSYRLFLDFKADGQVHTAAFTVTVDDTDRPATNEHTDKRHGH